MKTVENPLQPNRANLEVEIESEKKIELSRCQKCRILCGRESILVSLLLLFVGGSQFLIFFSYSGGFLREGLWVFFALGALSWLLVVLFVVRTCVGICPIKKDKKTEEEQEEEQEEKQEEKKETRLALAFHSLKARYNDFTDVNGKYYLTKMYAAELFEHTTQVYSLVTIYLCLMPVEISVIVCAVLTIELLINICATFRMRSQEIRDRLILLDIFTDIFCIAFPLLYTWLSFKVPVHINKMFVIMIYPTLSLLSKLNDIWEDYFKIDLQRIDEENRKKKSTGSRRRRSILNLSQNKETLEIQLEYFPNWLRYTFTVLNVCFIVFFVSLSCVQLATQPSWQECSSFLTEEVWEGCQVAVPFCQNPFVAECDCAVLEMTNYTQKKLPPSFGNLSSLVKFGIYTGELEQLPHSFGNNHKRLLDLRVIGNKLTALPESVGKLENLIRLWVFNNHLTSLPESVGKLKNLIVFSVYNNQLTSLPESVGKLKNLINLFAWNNTLTSLPETVGGMTSLVDVDVRHNHLANLPSSVSEWTNIEYMYVAGNPLCANLNIPSNLKGAKGLCEQQCSMDCPGVWLGDGFCGDNDFTYQNTKNVNPNVKPKPNSGCNTAACEYDKGDCPR